MRRVNSARGLERCRKQTEPSAESFVKQKFRSTEQAEQGYNQLADPCGVRRMRRVNSARGLGGIPQNEGICSHQRSDPCTHGIFMKTQSE